MHLPDPTCIRIDPARVRAILADDADCQQRTARAMAAMIERDAAHRRALEACQRAIGARLLAMPRHPVDSLVMDAVATRPTL